MIRMVFACAFIKFSFRTLNVKCVVDPHFWIALSMWTTACFTRIKYKKNDLNEHTNKQKMFDAFNAGIDELPTNALIHALKFYLDYKPSYNRLTLQCWSHGDNAKNLIYAKNGFLLFLNKMLFKWHLTYASLSFFRNRLGSFYISLNIFLSHWIYVCFDQHNLVLPQHVFASDRACDANDNGNTQIYCK